MCSRSTIVLMYFFDRLKRLTAAHTTFAAVLNDIVDDPEEEEAAVVLFMTLFSLAAIGCSASLAAVTTDAAGSGDSERDLDRSGWCCW